MQAFCSRLALAESDADGRNVVRVGTTLEQVVEQIDLGGPSYILVVYEDGAPAGVISTEELLLRISAADSVERLKWSRRPIETILSVQLSAPDDPSVQHRPCGPATGGLDCTTFLYRGKLHALATDDDLLVSWRSLEPFLSRAARDSVTGLTTRHGFLRAFECELARARRARKPLSVIMIDVDHFKQVNDRAGHATGDAVLNLIAAAVCTSVRSYDLAARFAGDEFVALCCECVPNQVHIPVGRIQRAVADLPLPPNFPFPRITLSIGAASIGTVMSGMTCEQLLERADDCLYAAKRHGRNCAFAVDMGDPASAPALVTGVAGPGAATVPAPSAHVRTLGAVMGSV